MPASEPPRPTKAELEAARDRTVPDVLADGLSVVFVGINPGLWSAATGHHFARPGNRFWKALHLSGFTDRVLLPSEEASLLDVGLGVTNLVARATATADQLAAEEIRAGARGLAGKLRQLRPRAVAILGVTAYRTAFDLPKAAIGEQDASIAGARTWVLPNPSGLNAHYQVDDLAELFAELRRALAPPDARGDP